MNKAGAPPGYGEIEEKCSSQAARQARFFILQLDFHDSEAKCNIHLGKLEIKSANRLGTQFHIQTQEPQRDIKRAQLIWTIFCIVFPLISHSLQ